MIKNLLFKFNINYINHKLYLVSNNSVKFAIVLNIELFIALKLILCLKFKNALMKLRLEILSLEKNLKEIEKNLAHGKII